MSVRVGINGFGRMGRLALRAGWDTAGIEFVHINEPNADAETSAHLLVFDSVHGRWDREVDGRREQLTVDAQSLEYSVAADPGNVLWDQTESTSSWSVQASSAPLKAWPDISSAESRR